MKKLTTRSAARRWLIGGLALAGVVTVATFVMASTAVAQVETHTVKIRYNGNCPDANYPPKMPVVDPQDFVQWQSVDASGEPISRDYKIYFDPFVGPPYKSVTAGKSSPHKVLKDTPKYVEYKYTVVGEYNSGIDKCPPLDPRLRVGK